MEKGYGDLVVPMAYYENQVKSLTNSAIRVAGDSPKNAVIGISTQNGFTVDSVENQTKTVLELGAGVAFFEYESFFSGSYADNLKNTLLKDTQFDIDKNVYKTDVVREELTGTEDPWADSENPLYALNIGTTEIVLCTVLGIAVIAIVVEAIILVVRSKKKKSDSQ